MEIFVLDRNTWNNLTVNKSMRLSSFDWFVRFLCLMAYQYHRLFNDKAILLEEQLLYYLNYCWEDEGVHTFHKGICPKVNVIDLVWKWVYK